MASNDELIKLNIGIGIADAERELGNLRKNIADLNAKLQTNGKLSKEDAEDLKELQGRQKEVSASLKEMKAGQDAVSVAAKSFREQCKDLKEELTRLRLEGKEGSAEYQEVANRLGTLQDAMSDAAREAASYANDTRKLSLAIGALKDGIAIYGAITSAMSAMGIESESAEKTIKRLQTIQLALNSAQQIYASLLDKSTLLGKAYAAMSKTITMAMDGVKNGTLAATVATKEFKAALATTGVGALVVVLGSLAAAYMSAKDANEAANEKAKEELKLRDEQIKKEKELRDEKEKTYNQTLRELRLLKGEELDVLREEEARAKEAYDNYIRQGVDSSNASGGFYNVSDKKLFDKDVAAALELAWRKAKKAKDDYIKSTQKDKGPALPKNDPDTPSVEDALSGISSRVTVKEPTYPGYEDRKKSADALLKTYEKEKKERDKREADELKARKEKVLAVTSTIVDGVNDISSAALDIVSNSIDSQLELVQSGLERINDQIKESSEIIEGYEDDISDYQDKLAEASGDDAEAILANIDASKQAAAEEKQFLDTKQAKERELKNEEALLNYKQTKANLTNQLIQALGAVALGIANSIALAPFTGGLPGSAIAASVGAVQTGIISAQLAKLKPQKFANGGMLEGPSHDQGGIPVGSTGIEVEGGEFIVNKNATRAFLPLLKAINGVGSDGPRFSDGGKLPQMAPRVPEIVVSVTDINKVSSRMAKVRELS